ncbi:MAG TPA: hypothetical protein VGN93_04130 [Shinella sp.]|jgi:hypothetical protein|uniref:hypothetical protein n=1 Tax=Shinella sp. TaxID=1870904 RepID=UPI002E119E97|nr:hypothetical protein [Shinella sp.]
MIINDIIARLIRSANEVDRLSPIEVRRLLEQAISMIRELRTRARIVPISGRDAIVYIQTVAAGADRISKQEWYHGLLHAAEMLRDLHIVVESGTQIYITTSEKR